MKNAVLLAYPFRVFFLLGGLYGSILALLWIGMLFWGWSAPALVNPLRWHAHEMLFGLVPAIVAGFLLTAICAWTGCQPIRNGRLLALALLWLAGRVAPWVPGCPPFVYLAIDLLFLAALTVYVAYIVLSTNNRRNTVMAVVMAFYLGANALFHLDLTGIWPGMARSGELMAIYIILLLMVIIGGRITPAFTANWLERTGGQRNWVRQWPVINVLAILFTALLIPVAWLGITDLLAVFALAAALFNGIRLAGWGGQHCLREPLFWILHLGYAWIVAALLLKGLSYWVPGISQVLWIHAAGVGAMGTLILGVMTRVALGHTGRPMVLPSGAVWIYILITASAVLRLLSTFGWAGYQWPLTLSAVLFSLAFAWFTVLYWPILSQPRADGKPG